jgi:nucleoside-diphosphate-sugar epimerase
MNATPFPVLCLCRPTAARYHRAVSQILITGASGFVGSALVPVLAQRHRVVAAIRHQAVVPGCEIRAVGEIGPATDWSSALQGIDCVVHLAGLAHVAGEATAFQRVNCAGTLRLAEAAQRAGVSRLIFLSSVKVNGEATFGTPFRDDDEPHPDGPYAASKWAAEQGLARFAPHGGMAIVILRPPLIYGPGVKANMLSLLRLCRRGVPLPFGAIDNRRSLLYLGNLVDAIGRTIEAPLLPGCHTYLLRDGDDLSTTALVRAIAVGLGRRPRTLAIPPRWLAAALALVGKRAAAERLLGSLTVDDSRFRADFAWQPPIPAAAGIAAMTAWFSALPR